MVFGGVEMMLRRGGCSKEKRKKERPMWSLLVGSGGWIRTNDLRVMSPTSYLCSTPHSVISLWKSAAKLLLFCDMAK